MKTHFGYLVFTSLVLVMLALTVIPAYSVGTSSGLSFRLFDPETNTHYYGLPEFYTPFGYYPYSRYLNPPPPVWIPPPPMTVTTNVVSRWTDPDKLTVMWTGDTHRTKRMSVAFYNKSRTLESVAPTAPLFQPYSLSFAMPSTAAFMRIRTFDGAGRVLKDILAPIPPQ